MKHQWLAYVIVGLLSIGAGVAIAGLPNNVPVDATIIPPTTTEAPEPTIAATTTTVPTTTVPETTEPDPETTEPDSTDPDTTEPDSTDPDTTEPTDSVPVELPERSELEVVSANGANVAGTAGRVAVQLEAIGYVDVLPLNGTDIVEFTIVYYAEGLEEAALRLAEDLDLLPDFIAPLDDVPGIADLPATVELVAYIGRDRA